MYVLHCQLPKTKNCILFAMIPDCKIPQNLPPLLRECWNKLNSIFMKRVKKIGITPDQYIALRWVHEFSDEMVSQAKLAELMCTDANNIAGIMKRMEIMKLIKRKINPIDNRQKVIFPTTKGTLIFQKGKIIADKLENEILSCFSSKEKKHFLALLDQLYCAINREKHNL